MSDDADLDVQMRALRIAADAVLRRGLSDKGLAELVEHTGDVASMQLSFELLYREIRRHVERTNGREA